MCENQLSAAFCKMQLGTQENSRPPSDGVKAASNHVRSVLDTLSVTSYLVGEVSGVFKIATRTAVTERYIKMTRSQLFRHFGAHHVYQGEKSCRCKTKHLQLQSADSAQLRSQNTLQLGQEKHVFIEK
mmetsp:Transcript_18311/g.49226  ORF Transcript_18311/g.49226 Transcript_18311/m.49226 type:complete len:128 (+) Transcript_18311:96-479(+)